jgi:hypothetical protein
MFAGQYVFYLEVGIKSSILGQKAITLEPPPSWLYSKPRSVHVNVPLLDSFVTTSTTVVAAVEIGRADSWATIGTGHGREVNILFASLKGLAIPHGIR